MQLGHCITKFLSALPFDTHFAHRIYILIQNGREFVIEINIVHTKELVHLCFFHH